MTQVKRRNIKGINPFEFKSNKIDNLNEALENLITKFGEYAKENDLSEELVNDVISQILRVYKAKKASYFFESKLDKFSNRTSVVLSILDKPVNKVGFEPEFDEIYYAKGDLLTVKHEQI